jgi:hypothetical protein
MMFDGFILEYVPTIGAVARAASAVPLSFLDGYSGGGA